MTDCYKKGFQEDQMNKKAIRWLLSQLDDAELHRIENKYDIVVKGTRRNRTTREQLIPAILLSKALPLIVKDLMDLFLVDKEPYDSLSEIEVTRLVQDPDTNIPALLLTLVCHVDPSYRELGGIVLEDIERRRLHYYSDAAKKENEDPESALKGVETLEGNYKNAISKVNEQATKLKKYQEAIIKLRQNIKAEKDKLIAENEKLKATNVLMVNEHKALETKCATQEELLKGRDAEVERLTKVNIELSELNKHLEDKIQMIEKQLTEVQSLYQEASATGTPRVILIGGKTSETLSQQTSDVEFLQEDELTLINNDFFNKFDRVLLPIYNTTTMTRIRLFQLASQKIISFNTHIELTRFLKGAIW